MRSDLTRFSGQPPSREEKKEGKGKSALRPVPAVVLPGPGGSRNGCAVLHYVPALRHPIAGQRVPGLGARPP